MSYNSRNNSSSNNNKPIIVVLMKIQSYGAGIGLQNRLKKSQIAHFIGQQICFKYDRILSKVSSSKLFELITSCLETLVEVIVLIIWPFASPPPQSSTPPPIDLPNQKGLVGEDEISELVDYEEMESDHLEISPLHRRAVKVMHNYVPLNPFRATVRLHSATATISPQHLLSSNSLVCTALSPAATRPVQVMDLVGTDSPASFPPTPFSRAFVMNKTSEKVVSVMFAARDRLRLEAQSVSRDEYSRSAAKEAQRRGQYAVFDPQQSSVGIALTCGNHCAIKVGKGLCCSCRSMIPIRPNSFVYFEFSITVSDNQDLALGLGLSPPDSPLNVMVGSWPCSIGLYTDGQVLVSSKWHQSIPGEKICAGSTIGMLVCIPSSSSLSLKPPELTSGPNEESFRHDSLPLLCKFNVNGSGIDFPEHALVSLHEAASLRAPLFPTVSLFSEEVRVWCRFCEADIVYRSRGHIQAPPGVRVYCLDGSLLLDENE
eukprot:scaffold4203_cov166-Ochromonas_danica.AAC.4